jgi:hypothetical protein
MKAFLIDLAATVADAFVISGLARLADSFWVTWALIAVGSACLGVFVVWHREWACQHRNEETWDDPELHAEHHRRLAAAVERDFDPERD